MRRLSLHVLLACVTICGASVRGEEPRSIYSDPVVEPPPSSSSNKSVYEKFTDIAPMDHAPTYRLADLDAANQRYSDAVKALDQAKQNVSKRLAADPRFAALEAQVRKAQSNYDDEIGDAMSVIDYYDDYQELLQPALEAQKRLVFLQQNSPNDAFAIGAAQRRFDALRQAVGEYEDGTLDNDQYVQQARRDFLAARDARDKVESDALAADSAVRDAQAAADQDKQTLDTIAAQVARNHPQRPTTPDNSAVASDDQNYTDDSDNTVVPDGDDSGDADQGATYDPGADQDNADAVPQDYEPVVGVVPDTETVPDDYPDVYPDSYFVGTVVEIRDHYHHTRDRDWGDNRFGRWGGMDHADHFDGPNWADGRFAGQTPSGGASVQRAPDAIVPMAISPEIIAQAQFAQQQQALAAQQAFEMERQARFAQARASGISQGQQPDDGSNAPQFTQRAQQAPPNNTRPTGESGHWLQGSGQSNFHPNGSH